MLLLQRRNKQLEEQVKELEASPKAAATVSSVSQQQHDSLQKQQYEAQQQVLELQRLVSQLQQQVQTAEQRAQAAAAEAAAVKAQQAEAAAAAAAAAQSKLAAAGGNHLHGISGSSSKAHPAPPAYTANTAWPEHPHSAHAIADNSILNGAASLLKSWPHGGSQQQHTPLLSSSPGSHPLAIAGNGLAHVLPDEDLLMPGTPQPFSEAIHRSLPEDGLSTMSSLGESLLTVGPEESSSCSSLGSSSGSSGVAPLAAKAAADAQHSLQLLSAAQQRGRPGSGNSSGRRAMQLIEVEAAVSKAVEEAEAKHAKELRRLQVEMSQAKAGYTFLRTEYSELEALQKETDAQRREYTARYAFCLLDNDNDGYVRCDQVVLYDVFQPYAPSVVAAAFKRWRFASGFQDYLTLEDFVKFVNTAEDRAASRDAQRFWFGVLDVDGDGLIGPEDAKWAYDAVQKPTDGSFVVSFEDLWYQLLDMVKPSLQPKRGFTASELWRSKLGHGVLGLLTNHNNMLLQRSTSEWNRGDYPL